MEQITGGWGERAEEMTYGAIDWTNLHGGEQVRLGVVVEVV